MSKPWHSYRFPFKRHRITPLSSMHILTTRQLPTRLKFYCWELSIKPIDKGWVRVSSCSSPLVEDENPPGLMLTGLSFNSVRLKAVSEISSNDLLWLQRVAASINHEKTSTGATSMWALARYLTALSSRFKGCSECCHGINVFGLVLRSITEEIDTFIFHGDICSMLQSRRQCQQFKLPGWTGCVILSWAHS